MNIVRQRVVNKQNAHAGSSWLEQPICGHLRAQFHRKACSAGMRGYCVDAAPVCAENMNAACCSEASLRKKKNRIAKVQPLQCVYP
jgi:hypothetical protein